MKKTLKYIAFCLGAILVWNILSVFCKNKTDGFSVGRLQSDIPYDEKWRLASPSPELQQEVDHILSQPFHYLAAGGQCFVFISEDNRYVIKFFKNRLYKPYEWLMHLPLPTRLDSLRTRRINTILSKIDQDCASYKIAYEEIIEDTGLVYFHLHPRESFNRTLAITDKLGIHHQLPLNHTAFLIQKRAENISSYLKHANQEDSQKAVRALLHTLVHCAEKGIFDDDPGLHRNFGFLDGKPIFIDVGRLKKEMQKTDPDIYKKDLSKILSRFRAFLESDHPELISTLDEELHAIEMDPTL